MALSTPVLVLVLVLLLMPVVSISSVTSFTAWCVSNHVTIFKFVSPNSFRRTIISLLKAVLLQSIPVQSLQASCNLDMLCRIFCCSFVMSESVNNAAASVPMSQPVGDATSVQPVQPWLLFTQLSKLVWILLRNLARQASQNATVLRASVLSSQVIA